MKKILIVEDEESIRGFLKINLKRNGYEVIAKGTFPIATSKKSFG